VVSIAPVVISIGISGVKLKGAAVVGDGLLVLLEVPVSDAPVVISPGIICF